jgi:hypothetical protein
MHSCRCGCVGVCLVSGSFKTKLASYNETMRNYPSARARLHDSPPPPALADLERNLLRQLCHAKITRAAWNKITRALSKHTWRDVEHRIVYAAIERLAAGNSKTLREQLPAQATRMGFPDIEWRAYFFVAEEPVAASGSDQILRLINRITKVPRAAPPRRGGKPEGRLRSG